MRQASVFIALGLLAGMVIVEGIGRDPLPVLGVFLPGARGAVFGAAPAIAVP